VIGFIVERITDFRHATPEDLPLCQQELSELHKLKMKHGDPNKHNFLIHNGKATLIDFDHSNWCNDEQALNEEYQSLVAELSETSGRGGILLESEIDW
jgi:tRNA A-37 threonylcarbamoyl transferase component Bud32